LAVAFRGERRAELSFFCVLLAGLLRAPFAFADRLFVAPLRAVPFFAVDFFPALFREVLFLAVLFLLAGVFLAELFLTPGLLRDDGFFEAAFRF
jgi:hypothetical protein